MGHRRRRGRAGLSTVVGGALVVGVILSVIAPLFVYMNGLTNFYDTISTEMRDLDQQRTWENLDITVRNSTYGEHRTIIFVTNLSPIPVNITRIWITPDISDHRMYVYTDLPSVTKDDLFLHPAETLLINDDVINDYVKDLIYDNYDIKFSTEKGNYFSAEFLPPTPPNPGYYLPLSIDGTSSDIWRDGGSYYIDLTIVDWMEVPVNVSYIVATSIYADDTGTPSQIRIFSAEDYSAVFPILFNEIDTPDWTWSTIDPFEMKNVNSNADVIKIELVSDESYVIGAYYFMPTE